MYIPASYSHGNLERYVQEELLKVSQAIELLADLPIVVRHVAPTRPRSGLYFADGTDWNPGDGRGLYRFDEDTTSFEFLG